MGEKNILRVAPFCGGVQAAGAWRFWVQGNEFYAAGRDHARIGKVSFHSSGRWQYRAGTMDSPLAPGVGLAGGWLHALGIVYLIGENVLLPINQREGNVVSVDLPTSKKLLLDVLFSESSRVTQVVLPAEIRGTVLRQFRLRNGKFVLVICRVLPFADSDRLAIDDTREKLRVNFNKMPDLNEIYTEVMLQYFRIGSPNVMQIIPVGAEAMVVGPSVGSPISWPVSSE